MREGGNLPVDVYRYRASYGVAGYAADGRCTGDGIQRTVSAGRFCADIRPAVCDIDLLGKAVGKGLFAV